MEGNSVFRGSASRGESDVGQSGVGILMQQDPSDGRIYVKTCVRGGAADREGRIVAHDAILSVDGHNTSGMSVADVRSLIIGPQGSTVRIIFRRTSGDGYECTLTRGTPEFLVSLSSAGAPPSRLANSSRDHGNYASSGGNYAPSGGSAAPAYTPSSGSAPPMQAYAPSGVAGSAPPMQGGGFDSELERERDMLRTSLSREQGRYENLSSSTSNLDARAQNSINFSVDADVSRLRLRNHEIESELKLTKDELARTRQLLDHDREASLRYVQEIDSLQRKYAEQIMELQGMLNQSDQVKRELEAQVNSGRQREEDFHEAFRKAKEQADARERHFADAKRSFESDRAHLERQALTEKEARVQSEEARQAAEHMLDKMMSEIERIKEAERRRREQEENIRVLLTENNKRINEVRIQEERCRGMNIESVQLFTQWQKDFFSAKTSEEAELEQYFLA